MLSIRLEDHCEPQNEVQSQSLLKNRNILGQVRMKLSFCGQYIDFFFFAISFF